MDPARRPLVAVLVRAQLLLGAAGCASDVPPAPVAVEVVAPATQAATSPATPEPPAMPAIPTPPPMPIAEIASPPTRKKVRPPPTDPPPDEIVYPVEVPVEDLRVAPTCGPCCHGSADCDRYLRPVPIDG